MSTRYLAYTDSVINKENPTGTGSFSLNRKADTTIGKYSFAEGDSTTASGNYSHAEGQFTTASGYTSHAEGRSLNSLPDTITKDSTNDDIIAAWNTSNFTLAKGQASHAEGYNTLALGDYSHAEGYGTLARGNSSHAEGYGTMASGNSSHAEGMGARASGMYSHAEGYMTIVSGDTSHAEGMGTIASGAYQHVQGRFNIEDAASEYLHIVGNGGNDRRRSNAHTLDKNGNAWYAGNVYVGGSGQTDAAAEKLATETIVNEKINAIFTLDGTTLTITTI